jgi:hypothetical protein
LFEKQKEMVQRVRGKTGSNGGKKKAMKKDLEMDKIVNESDYEAEEDNETTDL